MLFNTNLCGVAVNLLVQYCYINHLSSGPFQNAKNEKHCLYTYYIVKGICHGKLGFLCPSLMW